MKRGFVYLLTVLFLAVAVICFWRTGAWDGSVGISALISGQEVLRCQEVGQKTYCLFLPGFAGPEDLVLQANTRNTVCLNGRQITPEATWGDLPMDTDLDLVYTSRGGREHRFLLRLVSSRNVAALFLETASGSLEHIHEEKGNQEPASMNLYTPEGQQQYSGNLVIQGRGNDSWGKEKKPYSLELSTEADLLGMGAAKKWVLLANYSDPTHMRNKIVYDLADRLGMAYTPGCHWTEVYINGEYQGLYLLSERNEVHPQRVNIGETGFLVSMEPLGRLQTQNYPYVPTDSGIAFRIRETSLSQDAVAEVLHQADRAIHAQTGIDPVTGIHWQQLLDLDSWSRKYLIEEVFANLDANAASQFAYYTDGRLFAGPVWDYDLSMGSHKVWQTDATHALFAAAPHIWSEEDHPWFAALMQHPLFRDRVTELYETEFRPQVAALLSGGIASYGQEIQVCAERNRLRWACEDFEEHVRLVRNYLTERLSFLDSYWLAEDTYCFVSVNIRTGANIGCYAVRPGELLRQFPEERAIGGKEHQGWYREDTQEPFDLSQPIEQDVDIYLKWTPEEAPAAQPEEEPLSPLRLAPVLVFAAMLVIITILGLRGSGQKKKEAIRL